MFFCGFFNWSVKPSEKGQIEVRLFVHLGEKQQSMVQGNL